MKINEIINIKSIVIDLEVESKADLLAKMVEFASYSGKVNDVNAVLKAVNEREKIMSTGVGKSIALPHAKTHNVSEAVGSLAILKEPLDYDSLDGEPVRIVFLLLGQETNVGYHLRVLSKISRLMNNDSFRFQLLDCRSSKEVLDIFNSMEEND
jgi:fructose-specific phosphotransferase system IIA component